MTAGKSTVGERVAERLGVRRLLYDIDGIIVAEAKMPIREIMKLEGMPGFRQRETAALLSILGLEPGVVPTGGGIITIEQNREVLKTCGAKVVWLDIPFAVAKERNNADIAKYGENRRPLFDDILEAERLHTERQQWYEGTATRRIDATLPLDIVVDMAADYALAA